MFQLSSDLIVIIFARFLHAYVNTYIILLNFNFVPIFLILRNFTTLVYLPFPCLKDILIIYFNLLLFYLFLKLILKKNLMCYYCSLERFLLLFQS